MRIGPAKEPFEQQMCLHDWVNDYSNGIIGIEHPDRLPDEMIGFALSQFERFNVPLVENKKFMEEIVRWGCFAAFYHIDNYDPYCLLAQGLSDVTWSDVGHTHTIDVVDRLSRKKEEADPSKVEIFVPAPGQSEAFFNYAMSHPGLEALPRNLGEDIKFVLYEYFGGPEDCVSSDAIKTLQELCMVDGKMDRTRYEAYFHLAAWAGFLWLAGPPGKEWRVGNHDVFWLCETEGIALLYDFTFISKDHYTIHERVPNSCCVCGLDSYCVELVYLEGMNRWICEKDLNGSAPMYPGANCGSKTCKYVNCHHHPGHGLEDGLINALRGSGQMGQMAKQKTASIGNSRKLIAN